jgi:hypothetical protein
LIGVTTVGVGLICIIKASPAIASMLGTIAVVVLTGAILAVIYTQNDQRAFWLGFAVCGWIHLNVLLNGVSSEFLGNGHFGPEYNRRFFLPRALSEFAYQRMFFADAYAPAPSPMVPLNWVPPPTQPSDPTSPDENTPPAFERVSDEKENDAAPVSNPTLPAPSPAIYFPPPPTTSSSIFESNGFGRPVPVGTPNAADFHSVTHSMFTLLFAYIGGLFAACLYRRQKRVS